MSLPPPIYFTGAGFSKGFGGLLVKEMTARILSVLDVSEHYQIRKDVLDDCNYEETLKRYHADDGRKDQLAILQNAIKTCFEYQDRLMNRDKAGKPAFNALLRFHKERFSYANEPVFIFTTNQDKYLESRDYNVVTPGYSSQGFTDVFPDPVSGSLEYYKLHGSLSWEDQGEPVFIAGGDKESQLSHLPDKSKTVIEKYFAKLTEMVSERPIIVIGYSFGDDHINRILDQAKYKMTVIDPNALHLANERLGNFASLWENSLSEVIGSLENSSQGYYVSQLEQLFSEIGCGTN